MSPQELERYLQRQIPLSHAMQVRVTEVSEESVTLTAPLAPNRNHHATVFGGSASALAILSAWSLLHVRLQASYPDSRIVIQRHQMHFVHPIEAAVSARSTLSVPQQWPVFLKMLARRGKARIAIDATLVSAAQTAASFRGEYVAFEH